MEISPGSTFSRLTLVCQMIKGLEQFGVKSGACVFGIERFQQELEKRN